MGKQHIDLKKFITEKFGTIKKFADLSGLDYNGTKEFLNRDYESITEAERGRIESMRSLAEGLAVTNTADELTLDQCKAIKEAIRIIHGSVKAMGETHLDWSLSSLNDLTNGRRKRRSRRVVELVTELSKAMDKKMEMVGASDWELNISAQLQKIIE